MHRAPRHRPTTLRDARDDIDASAAAELADTDELTGAAMLSALAVDPDFSAPTYGIVRGDCNLDGRRDASDASALVIELFDGDGMDRADTSGGSFLGEPLGCDANRDRVVDAGDLSCAVAMAFGGPAACAEVSPTVRILVVGTPEVAARLEDFAEQEVALTNLALAIDTGNRTVRGLLDGTHAGWLAGETFPGVTENMLAGGLIDSTEGLYFGYPLAANSPPSWHADVRIFNRALGDAELALLHQPAPALLVGEPSGDTRERFGDAAGLDVRLATAPTMPVTVTVASSDLGEGLPVPGSLSFNAATWSVPQRLRIVGVDDALSDGDVSYAITLTAASDDPGYGMLAAVGVSLTNRDDEGPAEPVDPVAHWQFNETDGTTVSDSSGNGHHGTVTGGTWQDNALALSGTGSCVVFDDALDPGARSVTVAGWVKGGMDNTVVRRVVTDGNLFQGYQGFALTFSGSGNYLSVEAAGWKYVRQARNAAGANDGAWHHFAMVLDRAQHRILGYLDGSNSRWSSGVYSDRLEPFDRIFSYEPLRIGCAPNGAYTFIGGVDDFRYYHRALPAAEIQALFAAGR